MTYEDYYKRWVQLNDELGVARANRRRVAGGEVKVMLAKKALADFEREAKPDEKPAPARRVISMVNGVFNRR